MTNYEAIKEHPLEFINWFKNNNIYSLNYQERLLIEILANYLDCNKCPIKAEHCEGMCGRKLEEFLEREYTDKGDKNE